MRYRLKSITEHADGVLHGIAATEAIGQREGLAVRVAQHGGVLGALRVVQGDAAQAVGQGAGVGRGARLVDGGAGEGAGFAVERQCKHDLAEAVVVEVFGDDQRLREAHQHALVAFRIVGACAKGIVTSVAVTLPVPQLTMLAAGTAAVLLLEPLSVVWLKRSRA